MHVMFSSQLSMPSLSMSPASSIRVGSVSPGSTIPLPLTSSSPSSNWSPSVLLLRGSLAWGGSPYEPFTSTPSQIPSPSVSTAVGSVRSTNASYESFRPSPSVSLLFGSVWVMPSTSAVNMTQPPGPKPRTGLHGDSVPVMLNGPGRKYCVGGLVEPFRVPQAGLTYSHRFPNPSPSGSPYGPSMFEFEVGSRLLATSQASGMPSPSVSHPSGSSSISPSPSSSSLLQSASPSPSLSKVSTRPSLSLSIWSLQILPIGSSSAPSEPVP